MCALCFLAAGNASKESHFYLITNPMNSIWNALCVGVMSVGYETGELGADPLLTLI